MITKQEVDKQLKLFKEGEKLAYWHKVQPFGLEELAHEIIERIDFWKWAYKENEEYKIIEETIKVYQGFLDNGGEIDFTKE